MKYFSVILIVLSVCGLSTSADTDSDFPTVVDGIQTKIDDSKNKFLNAVRKAVNDKGLAFDDLVKAAPAEYDKVITPAETTFATYKDKALQLALDPARTSLQAFKNASIKEIIGYTTDANKAYTDFDKTLLVKTDNAYAKNLDPIINLALQMNKALARNAGTAPPCIKSYMPEITKLGTATITSVETCFTAITAASAVAYDKSTAVVTNAPAGGLTKNVNTITACVADIKPDSTKPQIDKAIKCIKATVAKNPKSDAELRKAFNDVEVARRKTIYDLFSDLDKCSASLLAAAKDKPTPFTDLSAKVTRCLST